MTKTLLYLCYGKSRYQQEAMFAILSANYFLSESDGVDVVVYTDRPDEFIWLGVETRFLNPDILGSWMGAGTYPFRRKVACLLDFLTERGGKVILADGDTYFLSNPAALFDRVGPGRHCLHMREIRLTQRTGTAGAILGQLFDTGAIRDLNGKPVALYPGESMWNSGIIGVHADDHHMLREALHLMDEIWQYEQRVHTVEQFALGHVMHAGRLSEADDVVFHYWHDNLRKPFLGALPALLDRARAMPLPEAVQWSYTHRPTSSAGARVLARIKSFVHKLGADHRWTRNSA
ncbi:hypothetical protein [Sphingomonas abietis]|uniref:Nucleotide-diphospho-sugar transferase domain-containing protein n=1 Tax=Sphingomonas abietis TaxID=3012344 RepID=A0ABY7NH69_9SPHN|nr:hypothetical protein [Sphingomonas abietis]WBO20839.1 hypothetical protein PBT88_11510 [Sphingomonas abietis]